MLPTDPARDEHTTPPAAPPAGEPLAPGGYASPPAPVTVPARPSRRIPAFTIAVALVAVLAGGALFMSGYSLGLRRADQPGTPAGDDAAFQPFWDAYRQITERYAGGEVDRKALVEGAIKGMFEALGDPYSSYLSAEEFKSTLEGISGEFEGIGAEIGTLDAEGQSSTCATLAEDCRLVVIAPLDDSPAEKAGVRPGDIVVAVDGSSLDGLTVEEARNRIRGRKGTEVTLSILRDGQADPVEITITRDRIVTREVVERDLADGTVGYIRLAGFSDNAAREFHRAIEADVAAGRKQLVIDLRGNPGGYVTAARNVASEFIAEGTVFWQEDATGNRTPTSATGDGAATDPSIDVVVLIDRGSASASEIVAGALKDAGRATLVGETTFGKGTVQEWTQLEQAGGFRLTVAKWLTPNGTWIHGKGIAPDVAVAVPGDVAAGDDPVLDRALEVLAGDTAVAPLAA